jgi:hypothetical protein
LAQSLMKGNFGADLSGLNFNDSFPTNKSEEENSRSSFNDGTEGGDSEDKMKKFIQMCNCDVTHQEHFHCKVDSCLNALLVYVSFYFISVFNAHLKTLFCVVTAQWKWQWSTVKITNLKTK